MFRGLVLGVALTLTSTWVASARAESTTQRVALRWKAPDSCPDDAQLIESVEGFLGQALAESREQQLSISVSVQGAAGGFSAKLSFTGPQGSQERFLEHPECPKLMEAAALLAALAIDPERVRARQEAEGGEATSTPPARSPPPPAAVTPAPDAAPVPCPPQKPMPPPVRARGLQGNLSVLGFAGVGTLPGVVPGVAAEVGVRRGPLRAVLLGRYWVGGEAELSEGSAARVELSLATAGLRACVLPLTSDWTLLGCVGADLGDMAGSGQGVDNARTRHDRFAAIEASFSVAYARWQPQPLLGLGLSLPLLRPPFGVLEAGQERQVFRPSQLGLVAYLGLSHGL